MNLTKWTSQERGRASQLARMLSVSYDDRSQLDFWKKAHPTRTLSGD
ncbi:hypothetical protein [Xylella fastidiosa]|nr:hypothetical protein [Xylella fastidiosa]MDC7963811.1 hypothetical protein [Xylella fastidiosa]WDF01339.1 hypothetical protein PUO95_03345 [Xylella fastidiosa subsp. fastidiosa]WDV82601.1 hypothetical protein PXH81_09360 [Xylella fastidiosa]